MPPTKRNDTLIRTTYPAMLAGLLLGLAFLTLQPVQAAPLVRPLRAEVIVTTTIQAAIEAAGPGDTVIVPAGIYTESLTLSKAVSLTGVNSGTTIIRALSNQRVLTVSGPAIDPTVVISGLTLTGGNMSGLFSFCPDFCGGGMLITGTAQPLLVNLILSHNQALYGGGIYAESGNSLTLINTYFISNTALSGGGLYVAESARLMGGRFEHNSSGLNGGGIYAVKVLTLTEVTFSDNIITTAGGFGGGGVYVFDSAIVSGGRFERNQAGYGGGLFVERGMLILTGSHFISNTSSFQGGGLGATAPAQITAAYFENNSGSSGGGLATSILTMTNSSFISNTAAGTFGLGGGGVAVFGPATVINGRFERNTALNGSGGGLFVSYILNLTGTQFIQNRATSGGGLAHFEDRFASVGAPDGRIVNALFAGNSVSNTGAALQLKSPGNVEIVHTTIGDVGLNPQAAVTVFSSTVGLTNTIIASHATGISQTAAGLVYEDYNLFFNVPISQVGTVNHGGHSLAGDPRFAIPAQADYHLQTGSAALDLALPGLVSADFEGDPRPLGSGTDIGFDEFDASATVVLTMTKRVSPGGPLRPGQGLAYTIVIANQGNAPATGVQVTDTLPASLTGASLITTVNLPAGQSLSLILPATVNSDVVPESVITNTAYYYHASGTDQASVAFSIAPLQGLELYLPLIIKDAQFDIPD